MAFTNSNESTFVDYFGPFSDKISVKETSGHFTTSPRKIKRQNLKNTIMRTFIFLIALALLTSPLMAKEIQRHDPLATLQKEVVQLFEMDDTDFPDLETQEVTVGFMINAKKEIIVLDVKGNSTHACDYVKKVLSYKKVKYNPAQLLTPYKITIRLVGEKK